MSKPTTTSGQAASKAIKSGALGLWADDPDDPIGSMVASVEAEACATLLAELRVKVEAIRAGQYDEAGYQAVTEVLELLDAEKP